jgi:uncharacterized membrane protein
MDHPPTLGAVALVLSVLLPLACCGASTSEAAAAVTWPHSTHHQGLATELTAAAQPPHNRTSFAGTLEDANRRRRRRTSRDADTSYDFFLLALFWPPSVVAPAAQSRARHAVIRRDAHAGFWTHGL